MQLLVSRAGLVLNPGQVADLVLAWRQVASLIASIPHDRPLANDMAYAFRLPSPVGARPATPEVAQPKRRVFQPAAKPRAKTKDTSKLMPKRVAAKPTTRKGARRRQ